jgi:hypothetical protein
MRMTPEQLVEHYAQQWQDRDRATEMADIVLAKYAALKQSAPPPRQKKEDNNDGKNKLVATLCEHARFVLTLTWSQSELYDRKTGR